MGRGHPLLIPLLHRRLHRLDLATFGVSLLTPIVRLIPTLRQIITFRLHSFLVLHLAFSV